MDYGRSRYYNSFSECEEEYRDHLAYGDEYFDYPENEITRRRHKQNKDEQDSKEAGQNSRWESMASWLQKQAGSHQFQLTATAVLSGAAVAAGIFGLQAIKRHSAVERLKASIPEIDEQHHAEKVRGR
jgi:hypothetical protein